MVSAITSVTNALRDIVSIARTIIRSADHPRHRVAIAHVCSELKETVRRLENIYYRHLLKPEIMRPEFVQNRQIDEVVVPTTAAIACLYIYSKRRVG